MEKNYDAADQEGPERHSSLAKLVSNKIKEKSDDDKLKELGTRREDRFAHSYWTSRETYKTGEINSVETTRLARTETHHGFLVHRRSTSNKLIQTSRMRQRFGSTLDFIRKAL